MNSADFPKEQQFMTVPVTDPQGYCPIRSTLAWFAKAGQFDGKTPNARQAAFYTGMQLEEMSEKLARIFGPHHGMTHRLAHLADEFKLGEHDTKVELTLNSDAAGLLDDDADILWVTIGSAGAQGADIAGAYRAVGAANWAKFPDGLVTRDKATGKVIKPEGWTAADLTPYTHVGRN